MFNWLLIIIEFISRTFQKDQVSRQTKHIGESGVKWDKKIVLSHTRKIYKLWNFCLSYIKERALIYFEEFFHAFGLFILDAIELVKISKIFRNRKKGGGGNLGQSVSKMGQVLLNKEYQLLVLGNIIIP